MLLRAAVPAPATKRSGGAGGGRRRSLQPVKTPCSPAEQRIQLRFVLDSRVLPATLPPIPIRVPRVQQPRPVAAPHQAAGETGDELPNIGFQLRARRADSLF